RRGGRHGPILRPTLPRVPKTPPGATVIHPCRGSRLRLRLGLLLLAAAAGVGGAAGHQQFAALALALAQAGRLADAVAQVVQLGPADLAGALHLDLGDARRVQREDALHALALHDPADSERLAQPLALAGDHHALEDLDALLAALQDALMHVDR